MMLTMLLCAVLAYADIPIDINAASIVYKPQQPDAKKSPFRYIIVNNVVSEAFNTDPATGRRNVLVLLDDIAFTEENLRTLFNLVMARFPMPQALGIIVCTSLEDIKTPEEADMPIVRGAPPSPENYYKAYFFRDTKGNEWFTYNPTPPSPDSTVVVMKGKSPYPPKKDR
ncbi:MAG: hypothetical protein KIT57_24495 [Blastocatellales bacterium]|nr:hypothetical protein [Blastocatellales bacterium]